MAIDEKSQNSQPMKHPNFYEWLKHSEFNNCTGKVNNLMLQAWTAALDSFYGAREIVKLNILRKQATIGIQVIELLTTLNDAEKIDCACDQIQIATGYRCGCGRGMALRQAGEGLGKYLRKLRKDLK